MNNNISVWSNNPLSAILSYLTIIHYLDTNHGVALVFMLSIKEFARTAMSCSFWLMTLFDRFIYVMCRLMFSTTCAT